MQELTTNTLVPADAVLGQVPLDEALPSDAIAGAMPGAAEEEGPSSLAPAVDEGRSVPSARTKAEPVEEVERARARRAFDRLGRRLKDCASADEKLQVVREELERLAEKTDHKYGTQLRPPAGPKLKKGRSPQSWAEFEQVLLERLEKLGGLDDPDEDEPRDEQEPSGQQEDAPDAETSEKVLVTPSHVEPKVYPDGITAAQVDAQRPLAREAVTMLALRAKGTRYQFGEVVVVDTPLGPEARVMGADSLIEALAVSMAAFGDSEAATWYGMLGKSLLLTFGMPAAMHGWEIITKLLNPPVTAAELIARIRSATGAAELAGLQELAGRSHLVSVEIAQELASRRRVLDEAAAAQQRQGVQP